MRTQGWNIAHYSMAMTLTRWDRVTHICVSKLTTIGSDNGLSPGRRQAIMWTNAGILLIGTLGTNFNEILSEIHTFSFKKMYLKISFAKWRPFCLGLNVLSDSTASLSLVNEGHFSTKIHTSAYAVFIWFRICTLSLKLTLTSGRKYIFLNTIFTFGKPMTLSIT